MAETRPSRKGGVNEDGEAEPSVQRFFKARFVVDLVARYLSPVVPRDRDDGLSHSDRDAAAEAPQGAVGVLEALLDAVTLRERRTRSHGSLIATAPSLYLCSTVLELGP